MMASTPAPHRTSLPIECSPLNPSPLAAAFAPSHFHAGDATAALESTPLTQPPQPTRKESSPKYRPRNSNPELGNRPLAALFVNGVLRAEGNRPKSPAAQHRRHSSLDARQLRALRGRNCFPDNTHPAPNDDVNTHTTPMLAAQMDRDSTSVAVAGDGNSSGDRACAPTAASAFIASSSRGAALGDYTMKVDELRGLLEHLNEDTVDIGELENLVSVMRHFFAEKAKQGCSSGGGGSSSDGSGGGKSLQQRHEEMQASYDKKVNDLQVMIKRSEIESAESVCPLFSTFPPLNSLPSFSPGTLALPLS